ncbi:hypothetical protein JAAARDRAFT_201403 [Jaapia argillacea MUCL 33604]|uniref:Uncharacterized protein n=1 Tax=Jaapia argillacea MUCL 33604 TaxID=933084 RepID=A0A067QAG2_9AGAM|nr:hypothetical protein JAAARDRAFT_201403 [Jaapia argillacea MUCL 33604]
MTLGELPPHESTLRHIFIRDEDAPSKFLSTASFLQASRSNLSVPSRVDLVHEVAHLEDEIVLLPARIAALQQGTGIAALAKDQIDSLARELEDTRTRLDLINSLLSPIRRLPPEILAQIFHDIDLHYKHPLDIRDPILEVCWHWREVALQNPTIWSSFQAECDLPDSEEATRESLNYFRNFWASALAVLLSRSGESPLTISLAVSIFNAGPIFAALCPHVHRLKEVRLTNWGDSIHGVVPLLHAMVERDPVLLETLIIADELEKSADLQSFRAPRLRTVALLHQTRPALIALPWSQLTHLHLGNPDERQDTFALNSCFDVLRQCVELTHCWIGCRTRPRLESEQIVAPIRLPKLTFLRIFGTFGDRLLLEHLVVPSLVDLRYFPKDSSGKGMIKSIRALAGCIERSSCRLETLELNVKVGWIEGLSHLSTVTHLQFFLDRPTRHKDRTFFDMISHHPSSLQYQHSLSLPRLQQATFVLESYSERDLDTMLAWIYLRRDALPFGDTGNASSASTVDFPMRLLRAEFIFLEAFSRAETEWVGDLISVRLNSCIEGGLELLVTHDSSGWSIMYLP